MFTRYPKLVIEILTDVRPLDLGRGEADIALRMSPTTQRDRPKPIGKALDIKATGRFIARSPRQAGQCTSPTLGDADLAGLRVTSGS